MKKLILTLLFMGAVMSQEKFYGFEFVKESGGIKEYIPLVDNFFPLCFGGKLNRVQNKIKSISKRIKKNKTAIHVCPVSYFLILSAASYWSVK